MAQQVKIAGALFNDVPYIQCPDVNDVYHPFVDPSVTTAAASDVAQGKQFIAADGTLTTGTASGGGASIVWGTIRGDAELAKSWTYDKLIHADEGVTIPSYSTTDTTLKSGVAFTAESIDFSQYSYALIYRALSMPIYSDSIKSSGRQIYHAYSLFYTFMSIPQSAFDYDGTSASAQSGASVYTASSIQSYARAISYHSESSIWITPNNTGAYTALTTNPTATVSTTSPYNTGSITVTSPNLKLRGNSNYLNSTNFAKITDIRYQYIFELWRVPVSSTVHGWEVESQFYHILDCANGTGTLT